MRITVGELRDQLSLHDSDAVVIFGDRALEFYRLKSRGPLCQVEFVQQVYRDDESGKIVVEEL